MENNIDTSFVVGYNGWCGISDIYNKYYKPDVNGSELKKPITFFQTITASVTKQHQIPTVNSFYLPHSKQIEDSEKIPARSAIRIGKGTTSYNGSISFELTYGNLQKLFTSNSNNSLPKLFHRNSLFHLFFFDGMKQCTVYNCVWQSISINSYPNQLVTMEIQYQSNNGYQEELIIQDEHLLTENPFDENDLLIPYWQTGAEGILEFSITFNRNITPVYLNNNYITPTYIRPGLINMDLNITCLQKIDDHKLTQIYIADKVIEIKNSCLQSQTYNMSTMSDVGQKTYNFTSIPLDYRSNIFEIKNRTITN